MLACLWFILAFYCGALILPASGLKLRSFEYVPASLLSGLVLLLVTTGAASQDVIALSAQEKVVAVATVNDALTLPFADDAQAVADWWADYWSRGRVQLPDPLIEQTYYAGLAQFGAAARRGCPPAALQGNRGDVAGFAIAFNGFDDPLGAGDAALGHGDTVCGVIGQRVILTP